VAGVKDFFGEFGDRRPRLRLQRAVSFWDAPSLPEAMAGAAAFGVCQA
jgi:hypothetical protein